MQNIATTVTEYLAGLSDDRRATISTVRDVILKTPTMVEITNVLARGQFQRLRQSGYQMVADGFVSYHEIERTVGREH